MGEIEESMRLNHTTGLYGPIETPTAEMLENVTALVFDIQDVGARFYTCILYLKRDEKIYS